MSDTSVNSTTVEETKEVKKEKKEKKKEKDGSKEEKKEKKEKKEHSEKRKIQDLYSFPNHELGRGAFSVVHLAKSKLTGEEVAVKVISKKDLGDDYQKNLDREIAILTRIKHPGIIAMRDLFETKHEMYIVMELVNGGELFDKIVEKGSYTELEAGKLVAQVLSAIDYLHEHDVVHRDLKPENLLLRSKDDATTVCIADFGLSKIVGQKTMMATACGTPSYVAPEVLNPDKSQGYGPEVDLWSIGVITYILLCGFPPFYGDTVPEIFDQILKANYDYPEEYWSHISVNAKAFVDALLTIDPKKRMTAKQALAHEFILAGISAPAAAAAPAVGKKLSVGEHLAKTQEVRRAESKLTKHQVDLPLE